jgi:hypothetical protein
MKSFKVLSVIYWILSLLIGALFFLVNWWASVSSWDYLIELVILLVLVSGAIECWKKRESRNVLQTQMVMGPVYLVIIGVILLLTFG